jgi:hypothetical protein
MALLTPKVLGPNAGYTDLIAQLVAAGGAGDTFLLTGRDMFVVNNGNAGTCTVTFSTVNAAAPDNWGVINAAHDFVLAVPTLKIGIIGPVTIARFKDASGNCQVTYSVTSTVTVGVFTVNITS